MTPSDISDPAARIAHILEHFRTIAVVGISAKPHRDSHEVAAYLQRHGYRIVPVNPNETEVLGERCYPSLTEAARHERIDLVDCFRNSADIPPLVDEAIAIGAKAVWMQLGVRHAEAAVKAEFAGLWVVQDRCIKLDHMARR
jgi:uncharacterized protein